MGNSHPGMDRSEKVAVDKYEEDINKADEASILVSNNYEILHGNRTAMFLFNAKSIDELCSTAATDLVSNQQNNNQKKGEFLEGVVKNLYKEKIPKSTFTAWMRKITGGVVYCKIWASLFTYTDSSLAVQLIMKEIPFNDALVSKYTQTFFPFQDPVILYDKSMTGRPSSQFYAKSSLSTSNYSTGKVSPRGISEHFIPEDIREYDFVNTLDSIKNIIQGADNMKIINHVHDLVDDIISKHQDTVGSNLGDIILLRERFAVMRSTHEKRLKDLEAILERRLNALENERKVHKDIMMENVRLKELAHSFLEHMRNVSIEARNESLH